MIQMVLSTFPDEQSALQAIKTLVAEQLIACGTIFPQARSIYRWKDHIEENLEVVAIFKMPIACLVPFEARLQELHPYEIPEILAFAPVSASKSYEQWVLESCMPPKPSKS